MGNCGELMYSSCDHPGREIDGYVCCILHPCVAIPMYSRHGAKACWRFLLRSDLVSVAWICGANSHQLA